MSYECHFLRRKLVLVLATSWWAAAALPALAGRPVEQAVRKPLNLPARFDAQMPSELIALADLPSSAEIPARSALLTAADVSTKPAQVLPASAPAAEDAPTSAALIPPSQNVTINLINRLVQKGVLAREDAVDLIKQAEEDAAMARAQTAAVQAVATQVASAQSAPPVEPEPGQFGDDAVRVTYIPETVKAQIREDIKAEVMAQARAENWAAPHTMPEWVSRLRFMGDVRVRYDGTFFANGNDNTGAFPNFNAINTGAPFDVSGTLFSPQLNVDQNRDRIRLRARLGMEADLGDGFTAGLRIATGENNSPVSTNQSFGLANQGQGGNFSKYAIWLDRGFLKYEVGNTPSKSLALSLGRFDNPFFSTDVIWDDDLGFDGAAFQGKYQVAKGLTPFLTAGAFPVFNTDFNFSSNQPTKFKSSDKWLYGGQLGADWKVHKDFNFKAGVAYYHFDDVQGKLSDPFTPLNASDAGNTDNSRPSFAQKGNTYRPIRRIVPGPLNNFGTTNQFQYFGLATPFRELAVTGRFDINRWEPFQITLSGEWVKNLAFDRNAIDQIAVNNRGPDQAIGERGSFDGGDTAWIVNFKLGSAVLQKRWDWQLGINYRYIESDAVVDGFNDSDFGLGGTNLKGYSVYGALALSPRVAVGVRYMSADEVAGSPFRLDILQVDLNGKF